MKTRENELLFISVLVDLGLLNGIFLLLFFVGYQPASLGEPAFIITFLALNLARIASYIVVRKQIIYHKKGFRPRFYRMLRRSAVFLVFVAILQFPLHNSLGNNPAVIVALAALTFIILKLLFNYAFFKLVKRRLKYSSRMRNVLLLGDNEMMRDVKTIIKYNPQLNFKYEGTYVTNDTMDCALAYQELEQKVLREGIRVMFIAVDTVNDAKSGCWTLETLLRNCNRWGVRLFYVPAVKPDPREALKTDTISNITIYNPQRIPLDIAENQIKKRLFDIVVSGLFLLLVMSWLFPLIALIVKLSSRGPVLFVQPRTGINNRTFQCYKFRSMRVNSDAHKVQATKNDPRITAIGRLMRRTNIDELPQFINVFWGDMSIVGPRPHMLAHTELFAREVDNYLVRHYVKPGITGWAQVNGYRGETKEHWQIEKRVQYDHEYIRNWTFDWDFVIVWKTIFCLKAFKNAG
ncbi:MAG: hypothetical protein BGP01_11730 [Paludibacter sp. 47-17]|nr:MAG: hypothetical protein ABS72_02940 [Paludibacter sp. SCN 50-10]OJX91096.1 MAG: hypothetical protein BGP01_11730 [Paludibacter sp. 47-17]